MTPLTEDIPKMGYIWAYLAKYEDDRKPSFFARKIEKEQINSGYTKKQAKAVHIGVSCGQFTSCEACIPKIKYIKDIRKAYKGRYAVLLKPKIVDYDEKRKNVACEALSKCNLKYGFFSLLWFKLRNLGGLKKRNIFARIGGYFCSYLADNSIDIYYPEFNPQPPATVMPAFFYDNPEKFDVVWEGYL